MSVSFHADSQAWHAHLALTLPPQPTSFPIFLDMKILQAQEVVSGHLNRHITVFSSVFPLCTEPP